MNETPKVYQAMVWQRGEEKAGQRVTVVASSLSEATKKLEEQFGKGVVFSLYNEEDADRPR